MENVGYARQTTVSEPVSPSVESRIIGGFRRTVLSPIANTPSTPKMRDLYRHSPAEHGLMSELKNSKRTHARLAIHPRDRFMEPMTAQHEYGWEEPEEFVREKSPIYQPIVCSAVTKYKQALLAGAYHP